VQQLVQPGSGAFGASATGAGFSATGSGAFGSSTFLQLVQVQQVSL
jgi:hypothetical protein